MYLTFMPWLVNNRRSLCGAILLVVLSSMQVRAATNGLLTVTNEAGAVAVVYNSDLPASREVAMHYVAKRQIPTNQVFGFSLPKSETMTRSEYRTDLEAPLVLALQKAGLLQWKTKSSPAESPLRYLVLCYGVPVRILKDAKVNEPETEKMQPELKMNQAAVDSELALLPLFQQKPLLTGPLQNKFYGATNATLFHATNGILMTARLDGPTPALAMGLVDKALEAERDGLWGRAYFDARGLTNTAYKIGDDWIKTAGRIARRHGYDTIVDDYPTTLPTTAPLSHIALYAGWYDSQVSGPFTRPTVEFMPGAFAYHLHSFSAHSIRTTEQYWVGPLINKGATITMGCVDEPYLEGTPDVATFIGRFLFLGFSFGEAAYASQLSLSWQTTVVGDPLYRPFAKKPAQQHDELEARKSKLREWSEVRVVNRNAETGSDPADAIQYIRGLAQTKESAVLQEKLGDIFYNQGNFSSALAPYLEALKLNPTPQQKLRIGLSAAKLSSLANREEQAYEIYHLLIKENPDYADMPTIYRRLMATAESLKKRSEVEELRKKIEQLTPSPSKP